MMKISAHMLSKSHVLVVGDVMLDRYWFGDVNRISPEAPVPVVHVQRMEERLGGAGNVAMNVASIGAYAALLSVVGKDEAGDTLRRLCENPAIHARIATDTSMSTTVKLRVISRQQQLIRLDFENTPDHEVLTALLDDYESALNTTQVVVLSDYGKGGLTHVTRMIARARERNKPVLVDPKGNDWERYRGATLLTPNRSEFRAVAGDWKTDAELQVKAQQLRESLGLQALLITRSEEGMTLYTPSGKHHVAAQAREVYDVSGAGDTVIAVLAAAMGAGSSMQDAVTLANIAGGIVVGKLGTATVSQEELFA
jgi:D-glycero-beta-D-manno-heptose-7-phosphate kinase